jgi:hypothetical protein
MIVVEKPTSGIDGIEVKNASAAEVLSSMPLRRLAAEFGEAA